MALFFFDILGAKWLSFSFSKPLDNVGSRLWDQKESLVWKILIRSWGHVKTNMYCDIAKWLLMVIREVMHSSFYSHPYAIIVIFILQYRMLQILTRFYPIISN